MLLTLTSVAGFLDAFGLTGPTDTFIANQTGNTVLIGIALADGQLDDSWPPVVAVAAFLAGGMLSSVLVSAAPTPRRPTRLLAGELVLLTGYLVVLLVTVGTHTERATGAAQLALITLSALAMGIQATIVRHVGGVGVSTTTTSGMLAEVGHLVVRVIGVRGAQRRQTELRTSIVAAAVISYIGGAALGALGAKGGSWWLLAPIGALTAVLAGVAAQDRGQR